MSQTDVEAQMKKLETDFNTLLEDVSGEIKGLVSKVEDLGNQPPNAEATKAVADGLTALDEKVQGAITSTAAEGQVASVPAGGTAPSGGTETGTTAPTGDAAAGEGGGAGTTTP